jgi:hypothetical protein
MRRLVWLLLTMWLTFLVALAVSLNGERQPCTLTTGLARASSAYECPRVVHGYALGVAVAALLASSLVSIIVWRKRRSSIVTHRE